MITRSRRQFLKTLGTGAALATLGSTACNILSKKDKPNIIWLVSEDNGPFLGCYGDPNAVTPNLDRFAEQGILYENAFANAPVCAPARSTIITGMYACSMGTHNMRSKYPIPENIKFFSQYLRQAGYYCTNKSKEDYNTIKPDGAWDESSKKATWENRQPDQPFFAVVNHGVSHESSLHKTDATTIHTPSSMRLPGYHPDTPEIRHDWAQYYDRITTLDTQIGEILKKLDEQGLSENTIVIYYADHGGVLPRSKRFLYDSGIHVPMIVRFPEKYKHLAPQEAGTRSDRLVSFVDLAPTMLSLAGLKVPAYMQGEAFLGSQNKKPRDYIYAFRGRMDERFDMMRATRDKRYKYIRNYMPHRVWAQYLNYLWRMPAMQSWQKMRDEGKTDDAQNIFFQPKPIEELYDTLKDPDEINNLAAEPDYQETLRRMRKVTEEWIVEINDAGFLPEGEMVERSKKRTPFEMSRDPESYNLKKYMQAADIANARDPKNIHVLAKMLQNPDSGIRWWAAVGFLSLGKLALSEQKNIYMATQDPCADVRITCAEALYQMGDKQTSLQVIRKELDHENNLVRLHAANVLDYMDDDASYLKRVMQEKLEDPFSYVNRVMQKALQDITS